MAGDDERPAPGVRAAGRLTRLCEVVDHRPASRCAGIRARATRDREGLIRLQEIRDALLDAAQVEPNRALPGDGELPRGAEDPDTAAPGRVRVHEVLVALTDEAEARNPAAARAVRTEIGLGRRSGRTVHLTAGDVQRRPQCERARTTVSGA